MVPAPTDGPSLETLVTIVWSVRLQLPLAVLETNEVSVPAWLQFPGISL